MSNSIKITDLGPFGGGAYTAANNKSVKLEMVPLESLSEGNNQNQVVLLKVLRALSSDEPVP